MFATLINISRMDATRQEYASNIRVGCRGVFILAQGEEEESCPFMSGLLK